LPVTHPLRLGVMLNYSVFIYDIKQEEELAHKLAETTFSQAIAKIDVIDKEDYKDSALILQLLRDNMTLWKPGFAEEGAEGENPFW